MAKGRHQKPYHPSDGTKPIVGLYRIPGKRPRWKIVATGQRFDEPDELKAIARFRDWERTQSPATATLAGRDLGNPATRMQQHVKELGRRVAYSFSPGAAPATHRVIDEAEVWPWLREQIEKRPAYVAQQLGIPTANLSRAPIGKATLTLQQIIDTYTTHGAASEKAKQEACSPLRKLMKSTGAKTLDDLTTDTLLAYRADIEKRIAGPATRRAYYARVKSVIAFGMKCGLDAQQIRAALDRAKVLWTAAPLPAVNPKPIGREAFHKLLTSGNGTWRPWLLLGLNLCLHMEEVCALRWTDFDLEAGTYATVRNNTRRARIPRAAVLWGETLAALKVGFPTNGGRAGENSVQTRLERFGALVV